MSAGRLRPRDSMADEQAQLEQQTSLLEREHARLRQRATGPIDNHAYRARLRQHIAQLQLQLFLLRRRSVPPGRACEASQVPALTGLAS